MSVSLAFIFIITFFGVDRWIRASITSDSSAVWWSRAGSFLIDEVHHQQFFWIFSNSAVLQLASIVVMAILIRYCWQWFCRNDVRAMGGAAIVLGGVNNLYDRFVYGGVWDYWVLRSPWGELWFNIADLMILFGVVVLIILQTQKPSDKFEILNSKFETNQKS